MAFLKHTTRWIGNIPKLLMAVQSQRLKLAASVATW